MTDSINILGIDVDALNIKVAMERVLRAVREHEKGYVCVTGVHGVVESLQDDSLRCVMNEAMMVVPDGMPLVWEGWIRGVKGIGRVYGPDLMKAVCRASVDKELTHFLYGGCPGVAEQLRANLERMFPGISIVGCYTPPFRPLNEKEEEDLLHRVDELNPDIFWVGLSTPKQERFMGTYISRLSTTVMLGVGAAFDVHTGRIKDAPAWVKKIGFQWLHRLLQEPRRLWRRYLKIVSVYLWSMMLYRLGMGSRRRSVEGLSARIDQGKRNVLGVNVNAINYTAAVEQICAAARDGRGFSVSALAVHGVMTGVMDDEQRYRLNHLDLVCPDGQPVRWALNLLHKAHLEDRVYGPNLTLYLCRRAAQEGLSVYLYGSQPEVLDAFERNLCVLYPGLVIAGKQPSLFRQTTAQEKQDIVRCIKQSGAQLVFVGLGCPRQEVWVYEYRDELSVPVIAVGAAFDFHAGVLPQAPGWIQDLGLEWLFRLIHEPRRLWKRYLFLNPYYLLMLAAQALRLRKFDKQPSCDSVRDLRYG